MAGWEYSKNQGLKMFSRVQIDIDPISGALNLEGFETKVFPSVPPVVGPMTQSLAAAYPSNTSFNNALKGLSDFSMISALFPESPFDAVLQALEALAVAQGQSATGSPAPEITGPTEAETNPLP